MAEVNSSVVELPFCSNLAEFPPQHVLYIDNGQAIRWEQFCHRVYHWDAVFATVEQPKVAVFHPHSGEFLAILTAAWRAAKAVILPPNVLPATLTRLSDETCVFIGAFGDESYKASVEPHRDVAADRAIDVDRQALLLYTSGSTGEPELIGKTFRQLNEEIRLLKPLERPALQNALCLATVPHHHMFGLTFKIIWPLLTGKPFLAADIPYLESLPELAQHHELVLICSPTHLANIPTSIDWHAIRGRIKAVITAGAPLPLAAAAQSSSDFDCEPTEIFGSTETGVVAWRHQQQDAVWQAFDNIQCRRNADGQLQLRSPALPDDLWFVCADKIQLVADNRFELCGRADKIVKVAGKRVSLTEIERLLAAHPWVKEVRVVPHFRRTSRLCAVAQLNHEGNAYLVDKGGRQTGRQLCELLAGGVERVAHPRYWRFVARLPVNQQGKTTAQELAALFQGNQHITQPTIIASHFSAESNEYHAELIVPDNLFYLGGHFPGQPILPGVVQIAWVVEKGRGLFTGLGEFEKMEAVKFQQVIRPGERFTLSLRLDSVKNTLLFKYEIGGRDASSGRIAFRSRSTDAV